MHLASTDALPEWVVLGRSPPIHDFESSQFEPTVRARYLTWLPKLWPANARITAAAIPDTVTGSAITFFRNWRSASASASPEISRPASAQEGLAPILSRPPARLRAVRRRKSFHPTGTELKTHRGDAGRHELDGQPGRLQTVWHGADASGVGDRGPGFSQGKTGYHESRG